MCCGPSRNAFKATGATSDKVVSLIYLGRHFFHARGTFSGRIYQFSSMVPLQPVDKRDAPALLQTRLFRRW